MKWQEMFAQNATNILPEILIYVLTVLCCYMVFNTTQKLKKSNSPNTFLIYGETSWHDALREMKNEDKTS